MGKKRRSEVTLPPSADPRMRTAKQEREGRRETDGNEVE
nr:MAG TPA: hypothetical protein [Caudoviricetes sp.]